MHDRVGVRELRQNLSRYLERVRAGDSLVVTDRGCEVARWAVRSSSALMAVEAVRAVARIEPAMVEETRDALDRLSLIPLSDQVLRLARDIAGPSLTSLDAIHLATAASLGDDLGVILTYDQRMMDAATSLGMPVAAPA